MGTALNFKSKRGWVFKIAHLFLLFCFSAKSIINNRLPFEIAIFCKITNICSLTLFYPWGGPLWPPYHESVSRCRLVRATLTKLPDFVPFHIFQVPESQFWCLFFKKLKNWPSKIFGGPRALCENQEKN